MTWRCASPPWSTTASSRFSRLSPPSSGRRRLTAPAGTSVPWPATCSAWRRWRPPCGRRCASRSARSDGPSGTAASMLDGLTALQVDKNAHLTTSELVDEMRRVGRKAARARRRTPGFVRARTMPGLQDVGEPPGGVDARLSPRRDPHPRPVPAPHRHHPRHRRRHARRTRTRGRHRRRRRPGVGRSTRASPTSWCSRVRQAGPGAAATQSAWSWMRSSSAGCSLAGLPPPA